MRQLDYALDLYCYSFYHSSIFGTYCLLTKIKIKESMPSEIK